MLTTPLLALLCAVPVLGEAGESCRTNADCEPSLSCVAATCTARRLPPVPVAPAPGVAPTPAVETPPVDTAPVEENAAPAGHFSGVHFFLGAMGGAGPMWSSALLWLHDTQIPFSATGMLAQGELRIGVLLGRFELAAELAPGSTGSFIEGVVGQHASGAISAGWMLPLYEREGFSVSLPIRVRGGVFATKMVAGALVGASAGIALRFGGAVLEARLLGVDARLRFSGNVFSLPFNLSFTWIF